MATAKELYDADRAAVYCIVSKSDGTRYVGSTTKLRWRRSNHISRLKRGLHWVKALQSAWDDEGPDAIEFRVLEWIDDKSRLFEREQFWMDSLAAELNTARIAGSNRGVRLSEDTKMLIASAQRGRRHTKEHVAKREATVRELGLKNHPRRTPYPESAKTQASLKLRGSLNPAARINEEQAREIYRRVHNGETQQTLADEFGIPQAHVSRIKLGKSWGHATMS